MKTDGIDSLAIRLAGRRLTRRVALGSGATALAAGLIHRPAAVRALQDGATPVAVDPADPADGIVAVARQIMETNHLRAVILRVTSDGEEVVTAAMGESLTGVPATTDMRFRNGAVAISYMTTLLLRLVDQGVVGLDDPIARWLPDLPDADRVTLRMLANMTSGYPDFVQNDQFNAAFYADPFRAWTPEEQIEIGLSTPRTFEPGTNWDYSHTGYVILGRALERIGDAPLDRQLREQVLDPLGLTATVADQTSAIPTPVLHAYSSERRSVLGIDPAIRFYEESTFWNPSWTLAEGSVQTTTIDDMTATAEAVGTGALLSPESHQAMISDELLGFGAPLEGCPNCHTLDTTYNYGLGVVLAGNWILQNPLFGGYGALEAYLPSQKLAIAVATTFGEQGFDAEGNYLHSRSSWDIFAAIGGVLAPDDVPPGRAS